MWLWINCVLLVVAAIVLVVGISFYVRSKETVSNTRIYVIFYSIFSALWCGSYGVIGITDNLNLASIVRMVGVLGIDGFYAVEAFLITGLSNSPKRYKRTIRIIAVILATVDFVTFSNTGVDTFVRLGNWTSWYHNPEYGYIRNLHVIIVMIMFFMLWYAGIVWSKTNKLMRQKKFIRMLFTGNFLMMFFALPDTFMPIFHLPGVPTSGLGSAVCTIVIWYAATRLNSFDIQLGNVAKNIYNLVDAGVLVFDMDRNIAMANPYAKDLYIEEKETNRLEDLFFVDEEAQTKIFSMSFDNIYTDRLVSRKNNNTYMLRMSVSKDDYGEGYCYLCVLVDVSAEINMVKELEVANNAKTAFLTSISHEIRTPINAVLGFNEMITIETDNEKVLHYSDNISRAGNLLLSVINDLLDMGQIASGKLSLTPSNYDLSKLIADIYLLQSMRADEKGLLITLSNDEYIPNQLFGDSVRIHQIVTNLLSNAIKYTKTGSIRLQIDYHENGDDSIDLIIAVTDSGVGIKEENIPYLYDTFTRFDEQNNRHIEGTGVGLSITKNLVDMMNGSITVESEYGKGSCFTVTIPQQVVNREPIGIINAVHTDKKSSKRIASVQASVLVVDDNEMNLMVFAGLLKNTDVSINKATSGKDMLQMIQEKKYDIIFLDHMMPGMDGIETLHHMKEATNHPNQTTPVIAMTANTIRGAREQYLSEGFNDYIPKPFDLRSLEDIIKRYLDPNNIMYASENNVATNAIDDNFPHVDGIDWGMAFSNMPDASLLSELVKAFYTTADNELSELNNFYDSIDSDEESLTLYRVKVHSMKNSSAIVGASELSLKAKELEYAANDNNLELIHSKHNAFINSYRDIAERLRKAITGEDYAPELPIMDSAVLSANLDMLESAMSNFDTNALNDMVFAFANYKYASPDIDEQIKKLAITVRDFDQPEFYTTIERLRDLLKN